MIYKDCPTMKEKAVARTEDETVLAEIVKTSEHFYLRSLALVGIKNDKVLADIVVNGPDHVVLAALVCIKDPDALCDIVLGTDNWHIALLAYKRLNTCSPTQEYLYRIAECCRYVEISLPAFLDLGKDADYIHLALYAHDDCVREKAMKKVTDLPSLANIFKHNTDSRIRSLTIKRMHDIGGVSYELLCVFKEVFAFDFPDNKFKRMAIEWLQSIHRTSDKDTQLRIEQLYNIPPKVDTRESTDGSE